MKLDYKNFTLSPNKEHSGSIKIFNKLANLEYLLPSITHEINNALSLIKLELEPFKANHLQEKVDRIAELTTALQRYVHHDEDHKRFLLQDCLDEALQMTSSLTKNKISIENDISTKLPALYSHFQHIKQVFINLLLHIIKQIKNHGKSSLRISARKAADELELIWQVEGSELNENELEIELSKLLIENQDGKLSIKPLSSSQLKYQIIIKLPAEIKNSLETI